MRFLILLVFFFSKAAAQQVGDLDYEPVVMQPAYEKCKGPLVLIDEAHNNFHTMSGRYYGFAKVLSKDGYRVRPQKFHVTQEVLSQAGIFVMANPIHVSNKTEWVLPCPSAFTKEETEVLVKWVRDGGSLFLIADHMPMPGGSAELASRFGFAFYNGFASDTTTGLFPGGKKEGDVFSKSNGRLGTHPVTNGIEKVVTFTGQGFEIPDEAISLLTFDNKWQLLLPDTAWKFNASTPRKALKGLSQGAVLEFGKGRIAVFGEAAMFTAQVKGPSKIPFGLNSNEAQENLPFLLHLIHWLDHQKMLVKK